jgi:hypothetical protein
VSVPAEGTSEAIHALQDRVNAALLGSDWETLNELIAADARIIGPKGYMIDRDEWIGHHQLAEYEQVRLEATETDVHTYDRVGIRFDTVESVCNYKGERIEGRFRVTQVWVTDRGTWQLAAVQYTSLAH